MHSRRVRELNTSERIALEDQFDRFREEYDVWVKDYTNCWDLLEFVHYEEVATDISNEVEPLIIGAKCVALHDCKWCMLEVGDRWHFAIDHHSFDEPVDLISFNKKNLKNRLSKRWQQRILGAIRPLRSSQLGPFYIQNRVDGEAVVDPPLIRSTLAYMMQCTPDSFEKLIVGLKRPSDVGSNIIRQMIDQYLTNLESLSLARSNSSLSDESIHQHNELMLRFHPLLDDLKKTYGRIPDIVERDALEFG